MTGTPRANVSPVEAAVLSTSRPNVEAILSDLVDSTMDLLALKNAARGGGIAMGVCAPDGLVREARRAAGRMKRDRAVRV